MIAAVSFRMERNLCRCIVNTYFEFYTFIINCYIDTASVGFRFKSKGNQIKKHITLRIESVIPKQANYKNTRNMSKRASSARTSGNRISQNSNAFRPSTSFPSKKRNHKTILRKSDSGLRISSVIVKDYADINPTELFGPTDDATKTQKYQRPKVCVT